MKVAFHDNSLNIRGTSTALYDYALNNELILGNESVILYNLKSNTNDGDVIEKFTNKFKVIGYNDFNEVDNILLKNNISYLYMIKSGQNDGLISKVAKTFVHCVFRFNEYQEHGDVYAYVSKWLSNYCSNGKLPYLPHIVDLPKITDNLRECLNIPINGIVLGRYGGEDTFDLNFVKNGIINILNERDDIYFLFMNTPKFYEHKNIIYLNSNCELLYKIKFINTCDYMLHARYQGETFGLAVAEFNSQNKKIITFGDSIEKAHLDVLKDEALVYRNYEEFYKILKNIDKNSGFSKNMYEEYSPEKIMKKFENLFLKN